MGQDRRKSGTAQQETQEKQEPSDSGISKQDSDSRQGQEGSRHGKGEEGGGQQSQQEGEGAAGTSTPSDAGKGASEDPGQGEEGSAQGTTAKSAEPTGEQGEQPGKGSSQRPAESTGKSSGQNGSSSSVGSEPSDGRNEQPGSSGGGTALPEAENVQHTVEPGADKTNLEYANQTTDLVLNYLQNQLDQGEIDPDLKKRFGWTDQDFEDFIRRYRNLQRQSQLPGKEGQKGRKEWKAVLRSLGLIPPQRNSRTTSVTNDRASGLRETGRSQPPREDRDRFDAFRKDILAR